MLHRLIRFSATNRILVLALALVALAVAIHSMRTIPLDALPDLSDTQVIVYSRWDRSPDLVEDQVTYPIVTGLLGSPKVKTIRGFSDFGYSFVYVIFEDGTDLYWARSRVLEALSRISPQLPEGVRSEIGPDATSLGWVFQYALVDASGTRSTDEIRTFQDWFLRYQIQAVDGVAEVATVGGQVRQYQVAVDPHALAAYGIPLDDVVRAVRAGNGDVGGRLVEMAGREYMVRGRGYVRSVTDLELLVLKAEGGAPVTVRDVASVTLGPEMRRGIADLDGKGDVVGGIVVMRQGENALDVVRRVRARLEELTPSLPPGVEVVTTYDRSVLITRAIDTVSHKIVEEILIVSAVILVFLWHVPSSTVPLVTIPLSVALAFIPLKLLGIPANLMSLSGIAISIGVLVDGAVVEVENAYNRIHRWMVGGRREDLHAVRLQALMEVGPSVFFSLLVIAVAFLPIFTLVDQEGRLFRPLAWSKNLTMAIAAILAVTVDPALRMMFTRIEPFRFRPAILARAMTWALVGTYRSEEDHPVSRLLHRLYEGPCRWVLRHPWITVGASAAVVAATVPFWFLLGREFMPPLREGSLLYMPSTVESGISATEAARILQAQDRVLRSFPEVERVFGKAGRADTSTDPAPLSMFETTVLLRPRSEWREVPRWYSTWAPDWLEAPLRAVWSDRISEEALVAEMDAALAFPGISNAWTMPIRGRLDMLSTGIRTPIGVKVAGADLDRVQALALDVERALRGVEDARSVQAERVASGWYLDFVLDREALARYDLSVEDANMLVMTAVGGDVQTTTVEGRARYGVSVRYARDFRDDLDDLERVLVPLPGGRGSIPMVEIAQVRMVSGPSMIRDENGLLTAYVYVDFDPRKVDPGRFVARAKRAVEGRIAIPDGYSIAWSGQYENMIRVKERLKVILPLTLGLIFGQLYLNTRSAFKTGLVMLAVPFSAVGAVWLLWFLDYDVSIAVWVGLIALLGLDAETGVFMLLFMDLSLEEARAAGRLRTRTDLVEAIVHGAVKRVRPKAMTVTAAFAGLLPIMWSTGTGADLMKRVAAPMVGGLVTSFLMELLVYPAIYYLRHRRSIVDAHG